MIGGIRTKIRRLLHAINHERHIMSSITDVPMIYYFGVPMHSNLGDLAQYVCIHEWFVSTFPDVPIVEIDSKVFMNTHSKLRNKLKHIIKINDLIVFQSGYCTQDIGGVEDLMHQAVMQDYPDNKMIMLPQTVFFKSSERRKQASRIYNAQKHLFFLARDQVSYRTAKEMFPNVPVYAYPDIVTTWIGKFSFSEPRKGILMCMRNDKEKYYTDDDISKLRTQLSVFDKVDIFDTSISKKLSSETTRLKDYIIDYISSYARYRLVLTDRYHGTIFSLIANTPVIVIKTNDHKVQTGVNWFKGIYDSNVVYADSLSESVNIAETMLSRQGDCNNQPYFETEYYEKLRDLIEKELGGVLGDDMR